MAIRVAASDSEIEATARNNPITHRHFDITACRQAFPAFKYADLEQGLTLVQKQVSCQAEFV